MKKNILKATLVVAFALIAGMNVYNAQQSDIMFDLVLANVEALARNEISNCDNGCWDNGSGCLCGVWYPGWKEIHFLCRKSILSTLWLSPKRKGG